MIMGNKWGGGVDNNLRKINDFFIRGGGGL